MKVQITCQPGEGFKVLKALESAALKEFQADAGVIWHVKCIYTPANCPDAQGIWPAQDGVRPEQQVPINKEVGVLSTCIDSSQAACNFRMRGRDAACVGVFQLIAQVSADLISG